MCLWSMDRIDRLAELGYLPRKILGCAHPICQACVYGKLSRRPWRTKAGQKQITSQNTDTTVPAQVVSVDQLESTVPGFIGQAKGSLSKQRYRVATIFVDHFSQLSFIYHLSTTVNNIERDIGGKESVRDLRGVFWSAG